MPNLMEKLKALVGEEQDSGWGIAEVDRNTIRSWADAFSDRNPLYTDDKYARQIGYRGIIAPPIMAATYCWMHRRPIVEPTAIGGASPLGRRIMEVGEFTKSIVQKYEWDFVAPLHLGDRVRCVEKVVDISEQKESRLGFGHFITRESVFTNQRGGLVLRSRITAFCYRDNGQRASDKPM